MKTDLSKEIRISHDSVGNLNIFIPESYIRDIEEKLLLKSVRHAVRVSGKQKHIPEHGERNRDIVVRRMKSQVRSV